MQPIPARLDQPPPSDPATFEAAARPWARYQELKAQDANIARYESWRGGIRDTGTTGASVAMELFRKQARDGAIVMAVGFAITILGFLA